MENQAPTNPLCQAALNYAGKFGFSVILSMLDMKPFTMWEEFQTHRATKEEIIRWWIGQKNLRYKDFRDRAAHPTRPVSWLAFPEFNTGRYRRRECIIFPTL